MKKIYVVTAVVAIVIAMAGFVYADGSVGVVATATVQDKCTGPNGGSISFNLDPSVASPVSASTADPGNSAPALRCTNNTNHAVTCPANGVLTVGDDGATDPITYTVTCPASVTGQGFGVATPIPFSVDVPYASFQDAAAGAHSDIITVTVTY